MLKISEKSIHNCLSFLCTNKWTKLINKRTHKQTNRSHYPPTNAICNSRRSQEVCHCIIRYHYLETYALFLSNWLGQSLIWELFTLSKHRCITDWPGEYCSRLSVQQTEQDTFIVVLYALQTDLVSIVVDCLSSKVPDTERDTFIVVFDNPWLYVNAVGNLFTEAATRHFLILHQWVHQTIQVHKHAT